MTPSRKRHFKKWKPEKMGLRRSHKEDEGQKKCHKERP
jgi:hypothetical protein